jgi:glycosyltransferase involved in cell wall biosynthesis
MTAQESSVTLVIPVYNEQGAVERLARSLDVVIGGLGSSGEVILVDDGSRDATREELNNLAASRPFVRVLSHPYNLGYGAALKTGFGLAHNQIIAICDADGSYPMEQLPQLLAAMDESTEMVIGLRKLKAQPLIRQPAKWFLNSFASYLARVPIPDVNSGFRVFRRGAVERHRRLFPEGFSLTTTLTMALLGEGKVVRWVPIRFRGRVGHSKIRPIMDTAAFVLLLCRMAMLFHPLRVFGPLSVALIGSGVGLLIARAFMHETVGVATTIVVFLTGILVFFLGLLADQINRRG